MSRKKTGSFSTINLILTAAICCIYSGVFSQNGTISGTVSDEFGALSGARVELLGTDKKINCDINGAFTFDVEPGEYTVKASYLMYKSKSETVTISFGNLNPVIEFVLSPGSTADEEVLIGSRFSPKSQLESPVSVDIISNEELTSSAYLTLSQALMNIIPSFHAPRQTIADGTDHVTPATVRGMGSDQYLVLINGKRRHSSSLVNVNGTIGRGSVTTDFDAIPLSAVDRVEVMRDGAGAQYGSDAIAGVINIILKEQTNSFSLTTAYQPTISNDGEEIFIGVNYGEGIGTTGFVNFSAEIKNRNGVNRSGNYTGSVYSDDPTLDSQLIAQNSFFERTGYDDQRVMQIGAASSFDGAIHLNAVLPVGQNSELYANGGFNYRQGESRAFYRFPKDEQIVVRELYPHGFSPEIHTDILDRSVTFGLRGTKRGWYIDLSNTSGGNRLDFTVRNSNNASMGLASPKDFFAGGFNYGQNTTNLDFSRALKRTSFLHKIDMAFGAEFRMENYMIRAGDDESWLDGGDTLSTGEARAAGSQGFIGFQPSNELDKRRTSGAAYGDVDWHFTRNILLETALRFEQYSDFGSNLSWKAATRYRVSDKWSIRGAYSTSFRAPSLQQIHFNNLSTQFVDGQAYQVGTFNNESAVTQAFGIDKLRAETSTNYSFGFTAKPFENFTINVDGFCIAIQDRIVLSGRFSDGYEDILNPIGAGAAQFFTNAVNTRTYGFDVVGSYNWSLKKGIMRFSVMFNKSKTNVEDEIMVSDVLLGDAETIFNREEISRLEQAQPDFKLITYWNYSTKKWDFGVRNTVFGKVVYIHPDDGDPANWVLNEYTGQVESRDQVFTPKLVTDLNVGYTINRFFALSIGGNNIFNVYPDRHRHSANESQGRFLYSRRVQQFGVRGATFYARLRLNL